MNLTRPWDAAGKGESRLNNPSERLGVVSALVDQGILLPQVEWEYPMRREMQEIMSGLYLGPYAAANKSQLSNLLAHGITHIVCVRRSSDANYIRINFSNCFRYLDLNIADTQYENIICRFPVVCQFLDECFKNGGKALVHGNGGISRSAALVIAYLMEKCRLSYKEAIAYVQTRRFCVFLNENFAWQLQEFEPIYAAQQLQAGTGTDHFRRDAAVKRSIEEDEENDCKRMLFDPKDCDGEGEWEM